jgi:adenosine kinase
VPPTRLVDPTGVGDAYRSGVMLGWLHGLPWPVAGRVGALAATYALEHLGTQAHAYTLPEFMTRYAASFGEVPAELSQLLGPAGGDASLAPAATAAARPG